MFIKRTIYGHILETRDTYPSSTLGWFKVCQITGQETRLP